MNFKIIFCILVTTASHAQNNTFDSLYQQLSKVMSTSTPQVALSHLSKLEKASLTSEEQIEVYMLRASLLRQYGNRDRAIATLKQADSLAGKYKHPNLQARIHGALSTLYRENGIETLGKMSLIKAKYWSNSIKNPLELSVLKGNLLQEQAYYHMNAALYNEAIKCLAEGRKEFEKIEDVELRLFHLASTDQLIGENYIRLENTTKAIEVLQLALVELQQSAFPASPLKGFIYNSLGMAHLIVQDYETSFSLLLRAQEVGEQADFVELKKQVLSSLIDYAKKIGNNEQYVLYNEQYLQLVDQQLSVQTKIADFLVGSYYEKEGEVKNAYKKYVLYSLSIGSGVILFISLFYYRRRKYFKEQENLYPQQIQSTSHSVTQQEVISKPVDTAVDHGYISKETEELILKGIQAFEVKKEFLKHEISLSKLASQIGVNHRYLSYVIKHHKQQDFSSYINTLRIDYIVLLLQENPETLKYKISYLADLCGFASHSRFTITFKRIKGISPSAFIEKIQEKTNSNL
ncbi:helix-turn-helix domain-containing protein [Myroides sp. 1354]|uniref:helix-turn-helix domain-containing protein n=1 Tax=unclassified Myroides TaxID=2642485 RepID=UPI002575290C|nr:MULTISPECIES: helix-turn-helix domain-containing protein [unclassified Myroides]MDM1044407.1 helix-turn-helix domain-containing protein [Myroides sp. R163-1]MDM1056282.1 helix-turn-helix domain-containing protein [Myroides sp. 1354]MDM1069362.1 helix-turn-helix domain-containing protein [Myroides sp. 1372]